MKQINFLFLILSISILYLKDNLYTIYMLVYLLMPLILSYIINHKKIKKLDTIFELVNKICLLIYIIFIFLTFLNYVEVNDKLYLDSFYYTIITTEIILINYFNANNYFSSNIITLLENIILFLKDNFILNLFSLILIFIFRNDNSLSLGIIGSYVFFFLTEINDKYNKKKMNNKNNYIDNILLFILNFCLIAYLSNFENVFNSIIYTENININYLCIVIFVLIIFINYYRWVIKYLLKKINNIIHPQKKKIKIIYEYNDIYDKNSKSGQIYFYYDENTNFKQLKKFLHFPAIFVRIEKNNECAISSFKYIFTKKEILWNNSIEDTKIADYVNTFECNEIKVFFVYGIGSTGYYDINVVMNSIKDIIQYLINNKEIIIFGFTLKKLIISIQNYIKKEHYLKNNDVDENIYFESILIKKECKISDFSMKYKIRKKHSKNLLKLLGYSYNKKCRRYVIDNIDALNNYQNIRDFLIKYNKKINIL